MMRDELASWAVLGALAASAGGACTTRGVAPAAASPAENDRKAMGQCRIFPADNEWNRDVSKDPVDPNSDKYMAAMNAGSEKLHPDFGSNPEYGYPWITVSRKQPRLPMRFAWPDECDPGPYPFPPDAPIEGGPRAEGDRHVIVVDRDDCKLYEGHACHFEGPGWKCESGAIFDLRSNKRRPDGWTSADAAGLPIFAGLVRRDEVQAGEIKHALRFTVRKTQRAYVHPATHWASNIRDPNYPPMGIRVRLKADYDVSGYQGTARVVLNALKKYGMFLADNGGDWFISGESNAAWDDADLEQLKKVPATAFEVVKHGRVFR